MYLNKPHELGWINPVIINGDGILAKLYPQIIILVIATHASDVEAPRGDEHQRSHNSIILIV